MPTRKLTTFEAFHRLVPSICKRINEDPALATRAMANPILAIEELGIELEPKVAREVERRLRFSETERNQLAELEAKIRETAGDHFNPESTEHIEKLLFTTLKLERPADLGSLELPRINPMKPLRMSVRKEKGAGESVKAKPAMHFDLPERPLDPLRGLAGKHAVVDLLLQYRAIDGKKPRLSSRHDYELVKANPKAFPISKVTLRLPEHVGPTEDDHA